MSVKPAWVVSCPVRRLALYRRTPAEQHKRRVLNRLLVTEDPYLLIIGGGGGRAAGGGVLEKVGEVVESGDLTGAPGV